MLTHCKKGKLNLRWALVLVHLPLGCPPPPRNSFFESPFLQVARMHKESMEARAGRATEPTQAPEKSRMFFKKTVSLRSSGRARRTPMLREPEVITPKKEAASSGTSPSRVAEKYPPPSSPLVSFQGADGLSMQCAWQNSHRQLKIALVHGESQEHLATDE